MDFPLLLDATNIGSMELRNRIVMAPMITNLAGFNGQVTKKQIDYYAERAMGGVGLIDVAWACVDKWPIKKFGCLYIDSDEYIRDLERLTRTVHRFGTKIALQLSHSGRQISPEEAQGRLAVSASDVSCCYNGKMVESRALTYEEIEHFIDSFALGAYRAKRAGFDAVELHGASGYLIAQFLSPFTNKRKDRYGGNFSGRMRFPLEVLKSTRDLVGEDFPIIFRISGDEFVDEGLKLEDTKKIGMKLEKEGIDAIHVTAGLFETYHLAMPPFYASRGCFLNLSEGIKQVVDIPVIGVGRINDSAFAEDALREGRADLIAMGRALLADPALPNKTAHKKVQNIRKCIACNRCVMAISQTLHIRCAINARAGVESETRLVHVADPKRVLVIGGGPAGMEAARVASLRGHEVILLEKNKKLGGQLLLSTKAPGKDELKNELDYCTSQLNNSDIEIHTGYDCTADNVKEYDPNSIIMATGARPCVPSIPGIDQSIVHTAWDVLGEKVRVGNRVVIAGGGIVGCETAEFLHEKSEEIVLIELLPELALTAEPFSRIYLLNRLEDQGVETMTGSKIVEIGNDCVIVMDKHGAREQKETDSVVLAMGSIPNNELVMSLMKLVDNLIVVGDCVRPRFMIDAIHEGFNAALSI